jgi:type 2 lantibiotic biosynthesis protein LanM
MHSSDTPTTSGRDASAGIADEAGAQDAFAPSIGRFTASARTAFAAFLATLGNKFDPREVKLIGDAADHALHANARLKLNRVLLLELHAARRAGELTAEDDAARFAQFVERSLSNEFSAHLDRRYPALRPRLQRALDQQRVAIEALVARFAEDRHELTPLLGRVGGRLTALSLGQGDLHEGGQTVAKLSLEGGEVMYKPRSLRIDAALERFLGRVFEGASERIRVPDIIDRGDYGWAAFVTQRYCESDAELKVFYRGLGHWLAVLRLLGGTDIHLENLIAAGPTPIVVDVESLFAAMPDAKPSGLGNAHDVASAMVRGSVLRTGIVPLRTPALGFDGVDLSSAGALPDQQPKLQAPVIVDEGTTSARLQIVGLEMTPSLNRPSEQSKVVQYWDQIGDGFLEVSAHLRRLDADGALEPWLDEFEGCRVRAIRRSTQAYAEIARMLWHPASLHDEAAAIERARDLFVRNALVVAIAPSRPEEIIGEIDDLRHGDVPVFVAPLTRAQITAALTDWRAMRIELEEMTIRGALVATELNHGFDNPDKRDGRHHFARHPDAERIDERRRTLAADMVERLLRLAVRGSDGSATWITTEISSEGWLVQPLQSGLYFGLGGVAVALAGYLHEVECGRAIAVPEVPDVLDGALQALQLLDAAEAPATVGGFNGSGAQIWTWLTLADLLQRPALIAHARASAETLRQKGFSADRSFDIIDGSSGAIVPLLMLAEATGESHWLALAAEAGRYLEATAIVDERGAYWPPVFTEQPVGGFAHGALGVAWSLTRLTLAGAGDAADRVRWLALADAAFSFQESLYDETLGNWLDVRQWSREETFHTWCNGSVGIGIAAADLYARTGEARHLRSLRRAVAASQNQWGITHTLCHGDFSLHELLARASALDPAGCASDPAEPAVQIISSIEEQGGIVGGLARDAFTPGLMTGLAGAIHSLNRLHRDCTLPSPLLFERKPLAA